MVLKKKKLNDILEGSDIAIKTKHNIININYIQIKKLRPVVWNR